MLISVDQLIKKFGLSINGVLHLGAHQAEEAPDYQRAGAKKVIWIEGNPELMPVLETELKKYPNQVAYNVLVSDNDDQTVTFKVTNNFQSSSILELGTHKDNHPSVTVHHTLTLKTQRLDKYFEKNNIDISDCDFLNIDLQGAELLAMKGLGTKLDHIKYIYTEINVGNVYVGCATLYEMDKFLHEKGFLRVATELTKWQWGDALYIKSNPTAAEKKKNLRSAKYYQFSYGVSNFFRTLFGKLKKIPNKIRRGLGKVKRMIIPAKPSESGWNTNVHENGEKHLLSKVIQNPQGKIVVFDVGANVGLYTESVLEQLKANNIDNYEIHLFEPQAKCFETLVQKFPSSDKIKINHFALSDVNGEAEIHADFSGSSSASLFDRKEINLSQKEKIQLRKLSDYMKENKIEKLDLLKIDTEGNEKKVLVGGEDFINPSVIKAVQFEYGGTYLDAGITLAEVVQLLMEKKYYVGKLFSDHIKYEADLGNFVEDYAYGNFVASDKKIN